MIVTRQILSDYRQSDKFESFIKIYWLTRRPFRERRPGTWAFSFRLVLTCCAFCRTTERVTIELFPKHPIPMKFSG
jgi:hypothetical protein